MGQNQIKQYVEQYRGAVVTGGSSGIGKAFIRALIDSNDKLVVCNLSRSKPEDFSNEHRVRHIPCDLTEQSEIGEMLPEVRNWIREEVGEGRLMLVNNSGAGAYGKFPEPGAARHTALVDLNVRAVVHLTAELLPELQQRGGAVVNVASTAAFQPCPMLATYGATKAFLMNWSLGLWDELRGSEVHVLAVCPGPTRTNFFRAAGFDERPIERFKGLTPEHVTTTSLRALARGKPVVVCGLTNKLMAWTSLRAPLPLGWTTRIAGRVLRQVRTEG